MPAAIHKDGIGDIDFVYGNDDYGLAHIIKRRNEQGINGIELVKELPNFIDKGNIVKTDREHEQHIEYDGNKVVIKQKYKGKKNNWIITAFKKYRP